MKQYIVIIFVLLGFACQRKTTPQKSNVVINERPTLTRIDSIPFYKTLAKHIETSIIPFEYFTAKYKIDLDEKGALNSFTANVRMKKDSVIWVSISPALGIEAARALIRKDSIFLLDRLRQKAYQYPYSYIKQYGIPFLFADLQDALVGNPLAPFHNNAKAFKNGDYWVYKAYKDTLEGHWHIDSTQFFWKALLLFDNKNKESIQYQLSEYNAVKEDAKEYNISTHRTMQYSRKPNTTYTIDLSNIKINVPCNFPFAIPTDYTYDTTNKP